MKTLAFTIIMVFAFNLLSPGVSSAADFSVSQKINEIEKMLKMANEKHMNGQEIESLEIYQEVLQMDEVNLEALWNSAVLHAKIGHRKESEKEKRQHYEKALELAETAKKHHGDKGYSYYAYAVALGRMTNIMGTSDRIEASHDVKANIQKATEMMPDFAPAWHLFGVWHSDVANVSAAVKAAAGLFSKGLPDASNQKAEEYLEKAVTMDKEKILFHLDLAKHLLKVDKRDRARTVLEKIVRTEPKMKDDPAYKKEAEELLSSLG